MEDGFQVIIDTRKENEFTFSIYALAHGGSFAYSDILTISITEEVVD